MDKWISVEDRLPEEGGEYWCKDDYIEFPAFYGRTLNQNRAWLMPNENLVITHWMPLLAKPKDNEKT